jgi:site-specific DNA-methyltransferase (adenine-specific)
MAAPNFVNRTLWTGDNLDLLRGMNSECVDLIYLDPPFNSNRDYAAPVGSAAAGAAFKDTWTLSDLDVAWMGLIADEQPAMYQALMAAGLAHGKGMQSYLAMMGVRLLEMRRVLKPTGSIYLHCDPTASHYLKMLMDSVFGQRQFRNEVVWAYRGGGVPKYDFARKHDIILRYSKTPVVTFNVDAVRIPYSEDSSDRLRYKAKSFRGNRTYDAYEQNPKGKHPEDWWTLQPIMPSSGERTGYPTQKPLALLERIIKASSNEGDMVLDPFCGCATACVAAERLGRQWAGIDLSPKAAELVQYRLKQQEPGIALWASQVAVRTDIDAPIPYRQNKHVLFGQQEGICNGCKTEFSYRILEVDHIIPQSKGGADHLENLQLLCFSCNRIKGNRPQEYLITRLKEMAL